MTIYGDGDMQVHVNAWWESVFDQIQSDYVAEHWMTEILLNTDMELMELLYHVQFIQENGYGSLVSTNSVRIPLATIAQERGVPMTDGSRMKHDH